VPLRSHWKALRQGRLPGQLVVQLTDRCNAGCPQCGMNIRERFARRTLSLDHVRRMIDAAAAEGFAAVSFTGGEPLLVMEALIDLLQYAGMAGIDYIRTGTNGFWFRAPGRPDFEDRVTRLAEALAGTPLRNFWISIDSADPATHDEMRGFSGLLRGIERALPIFHAHGLYPAANLGINRNMGGPASIPFLARANGDPRGVPAAEFRRRLHRGLDGFFRLAADMGFTMANVCYPMSIEDTAAADDLQAVYGATATSAIVSFTPREKAHLFEVLAQVVAENRSRLRIFTPLCALYVLARQLRTGRRGYACRGGRDFFFVDARRGHAFPCGYRGDEDLGRFEDRAASGLSRDAACSACEWECFRDPSELGGPLLTLFENPLKMLRHWREDPMFFKRWRRDLGYYRDCDFFDGRRPSRPERLKRYRVPIHKRHLLASGGDLASCRSSG